MSLRWVLYAQAAATLFMVGLIWFVQVVHYPLFSEVARLAGAEAFAQYEARHTALTTLVVGPPMLVELASAALLIAIRPAGIPGWAAWVGLLLVGAIWASTALLQVPRHGELASGFRDAAHQALVSTNWIRTAAWTLRAPLALWMLERGLTKG